MTIKHLDRRLSRLATVQALYQMDMAGTDLDTVCLQYTGSETGPVLEESAATPLVNEHDMDKPFFEDLVRGIVKEQKIIDPHLSELLSKGWSLKRLDSILRAILRAGAYELLYRTDVPAKSVINEYLEISHGYFGGEEPKLINGVLDKLSKQAQT